MNIATMGSPTTPVQDCSFKVPDTKERSAYFWHCDNRRNASAQEVANAHGISKRTGKRWRRKRVHCQNYRRVRKRKAEEKDQKLGRRF
jgi:transposase